MKKIFLLQNSTIPNLIPIIFGLLKKEEQDFFKEKLPAETLRHFTELIITNNNEDFSVKYYLNHNFIYIMCFKNKSLTISNRFDIKSEDDALYFILNLIKESDLINNKLKIHSYGLINQDQPS